MEEKVTEKENKYQISKWTLFMDTFMSRFISLGGLSVIVAVLLILVFITKEVIPLMEKAQVKEEATVDVPKVDYQFLAIDEWTTLPALISNNAVYFVDLQTADNDVEAIDYKRDGDKAITACNYIQQDQIICLGNEAGKFSIAEINYKKKFLDEYEDGRRKSLTIHEFSQGEYLPLSENETDKIVEIRYAKTESRKIVAGIVDRQGEKRLIVAVLEQAVDLFGGTSGELEVSQRIDFTDTIKGKISHIELSSQADTLVAATEEGEVYSFRGIHGKLEYNQTFMPFKNEQNKTISSMDYLFGSSTLIFTNPEGRMLGFSMFKPGKDKPRVFGKTKDGFANLNAGSSYFARSLRNKAFICGNKNFISLRYSTHESVNWEKELDYEAVNAIISGKYNKILVADKASKLHIYDLKDPHPEAGFKTYFGKIWYEGQPEPNYKWESTGGTEEQEKMLSMVPLIFGTLKATFYAMMFAVPIALLAAIYTSQFLPPRFKAIVKPLMEVMASLPSVIIGFVAAVTLAPLVEDKVPSLILVFIAVPASAILMGLMWQKFPPNIRVKCRPGMEFIFFLPVMALVIYVAWNLGPGFEEIFFTVTDDSGKRIASFPYWWNSATGLSYTQKNAMIVGFAMGFAVIPIIFTISEDSLSNVPKAVTSASLALGASRWQTTWRVVLPTASAGIFSACMIGFGRAVGETMIVLCAAGGTALMEMNIFSGMRTLSINLATELPEAAKNGTLYRSLFLGALILFVITFIVNTLAEVIRQHIRNKYKTI